MYHHVAPDRAITPAVFESQLRWLKDNGYNTLDSGALRAHLTGGRPAPGRSVVITFDDGYADNWVYAFPLLKKAGFKSIMFVVTGRMRDADRPRPTSEEGGAVVDTVARERDPEGFMTWPELKAMADSGLVEIGSHTRTHRDWEKSAPYADLRGELEGSRRDIESRLGSWAGTFAWPWGDFKEEWLPLLSETGYRTGFTTMIGGNTPGTDPFLICRLDVRKASLGWFARRVRLYRHPMLVRAYGRFYGLDRRLKRAYRGLLR
jgi:peptidoglycan/xylan/chitin deacetylase (PgdA/CDA1 family)